MEVSEAKNCDGKGNDVSAGRPLMSDDAKIKVFPARPMTRRLSQKPMSWPRGVAKRQRPSIAMGRLKVRPEGEE